jgi:hypothetical protein
MQSFADEPDRQFMLLIQLEYVPTDAVIRGINAYMNRKVQVYLEELGAFTH